MTAVLHDIWSATLERVREKVDPRRFHLWFKETELLCAEAGHFQIGVPSRFVAEWLDEHLKDAVSDSLTEAAEVCQSVRFVVSPKLFRKVQAKRIEAQQELLDELPGGKPAPDRDDLRNYSLESFVVGHCNRMAYAAARHVADGIDTQLNPLFIHGAVGLGKTHLLRGICAKVNSRPNTRAYYTSGENFTNQFVASLQHRSLDAFRARFRNVDLLAIDDIHFLANKKATQEEFLHTYDCLSRLNKQIVMASDAHPRTINCVMESLSSRITSGMTIRLDAPDYETRMAILHHMLRDYDNVLSDKVLDFVAQNVQSSVRDLQGAATTLLATARLLGRTVDIDTARQALQSLLVSARRRITLADVEREVCRAFDVSPHDLLSPRRSKSITMPRHAAMYLARELTDHSWQEIGSHFKRRNHSAAIFGHKRTAERIRLEPDFHERVREIVSALRNSPE